MLISSVIASTLLMSAVAPTLQDTARQPCRSLNSEKVVLRLSELPMEISADLRTRIQDIVDPGQPFRASDADAGAGKSNNRLLHAIFIQGEWFVSLETGMPYSKVTIGYVKVGNGGFRRWHLHYLGGPPCLAIQAAVAGVTTPGGFNY